MPRNTARYVFKNESQCPSLRTPTPPLSSSAQKLVAESLGLDFVVGLVVAELAKDYFPADGDEETFHARGTACARYLSSEGVVLVVDCGAQDEVKLDDPKGRTQSLLDAADDLATARDANARANEELHKLAVEQEAKRIADEQSAAAIDERDELRRQLVELREEVDLMAGRIEALEERLAVQSQTLLDLKSSPSDGEGRKDDVEPVAPNDA